MCRHSSSNGACARSRSTKSLNNRNESQGKQILLQRKNASKYFAGKHRKRGAAVLLLRIPRFFSTWGTHSFTYIYKAYKNLHRLRFRLLSGRCMPAHRAALVKCMLSALHRCMALLSRWFDAVTQIFIVCACIICISIRLDFVFKLNNKTHNSNNKH